MLTSCVAAPTTPGTPALPVPQDMASWVRDGIGGLQSVVLYSLPELDGAIDTGTELPAPTMALPPRFAKLLYWVACRPGCGRGGGFLLLPLLLVHTQLAPSRLLAPLPCCSAAGWSGGG